MQKTPFYNSHLKYGAKIVDFCGWELPISYGSQIKEHEFVRSDAGMFDVSHMVITDISGVEARKFLMYILSNDVQKLDKYGLGKALYSTMLNHDAGIIDDLIVYLMPFGYRLVTNASTKQKDLAWIKMYACNFKVDVNVRNEYAMIAIQGPNAINMVSKIKPYLQDRLLNLKSFMAVEDNDWLFARTGYTGENGLEVMLPATNAETFWDDLYNVGVLPCGLGARDTLRLEAGMNLYGHDMDEKVSPLECGIEWVVDLTDDSRDFIGKEKYLQHKNNLFELRYQVGLLLDGKGVLREGQEIINNGLVVGQITSGTFSPTLKKSIAIARINKNIAGNIAVNIRGNLEAVKITTLPFVRNGKTLIV